MCFYYYIITVYDEKYNKYTEMGYTVGEDYKHALDYLTEYYGENEIIKVNLEYIADRPILVLPTQDAINKKGFITAIKENNYI